MNLPSHPSVLDLAILAVRHKARLVQSGIPGQMDGRLIKSSLYTYVTNSMRRRSHVDIVGPKGTASAASVRVCFLPY